MQGDIQYRTYDGLGDLEQVMLRTAVNYSLNPHIRFALGYANISSGTYGNSREISVENRIFQEALMSHKISEIVYVNHRFRLEQRWLENQDLRTRYRYYISMNVPLNQKTLSSKALYLSFYNEIFINGEKNIGNNRSVELFDRNRIYGAIGYAFKDNLKLQLGFMEQTTNTLSKGQLQFSILHNF